MSMSGQGTAAPAGQVVLADDHVPVDGVEAPLAENSAMRRPISEEIEHSVVRDAAVT